MTDISLADISPDPAEKAAEAATEAATDNGEGSGEFIMQMVEKLDEKGLLEPVLFGQDAIPDPDPNVGNAGVEAVEQGGGEGGGEIDAEEIAEIGKKVIDTAGDLKISQVVQLAEQNPEQVNRLIQQNRGGEAE